MAKRFGRQQKRKLRAKVEALESQLWQGRIANQRRDELLERTAAILGRHFAGLEPGGLEVGSTEIKNSTHIGVGRLRALAPNLEAAPLSIGALEEAVNYLEILSGTTVLDDLTDMVHYRLRSPAGELAYAVDKRALLTMPKDELVIMVAKELAEHFVRNVREESREAGE